MCRNCGNQSFFGIGTFTGGNNGWPWENGCCGGVEVTFGNGQQNNNGCSCRRGGNRRNGCCGG